MAIVLLEVFIVAVLVALVITLVGVRPAVGVLAMAAVSPIVLLSFTFLHYERRGRPWSFAGAAGLGGVGVLLRVVVSTHPDLEVGGGLPTAVSALYIALGILLVVSSCRAFVAIRAPASSRTGQRI